MKYNMLIGEVKRCFPADFVTLGQSQTSCDSCFQPSCQTKFTGCCLKPHIDFTVLSDPLAGNHCISQNVELFVYILLFLSDSETQPHPSLHTHTPTHSQALPD